MRGRRQNKSYQRLRATLHNDKRANSLRRHTNPKCIRIQIQEAETNGTEMRNRQIQNYN